MNIAPALLQDEELQPLLLRKLSFDSLDDMYAAIGYGGITAVKAIGKIREDLLKASRAPAAPKESKVLDIAQPFQQDRHGNSGVMYRAAKDARRKWGLMGYQADMDSNNSYTGIMYGEEIGGILTGRGQKCKIGTDRKAVVLEQFATSDELAKKINFEDWNTYRIVVKGNVMTHYINGVMMSQTIEEDPSQLKSGAFGMQIHPGPPMTVQFKNIYLKKL